MKVSYNRRRKTQIAEERYQRGKRAVRKGIGDFDKMILNEIVK